MNHLIAGIVWAGELLQGKTIAEVVSNAAHPDRFVRQVPVPPFLPASCLVRHGSVRDLLGETPCHD
jgi:hypothetical protein